MFPKVMRPGQRSDGKMGAWKPHLLHLGSFVSWERMHLVFAFAQGSHAEPHPADHFMFRREYTKSPSEITKLSLGRSGK